MNSGFSGAGSRGAARGLVAVVAIGLLSGVPRAVFAEENCCERDLAVLPVSMPEGQLVDVGSQMGSAISSAFTAKGGALRHCPLRLVLKDLEGAEGLAGFIDKLSSATGGSPPGLSPQQIALYEMDYLVVGAVSVIQRRGATKRECAPGTQPGTQVCSGGELLGDFTATVKLLDHHHGQTVKSAVYAWSGTLSSTGFGAGFETWVDATFNPLDDLIYDYEQKPQQCRITSEESHADTVQSGDTVTVRLSEIFDHNSRPSQKWQRVWVKADKGRILNGREKGEYRVFDIGDGTLSPTYEGPDDCKPAKDTITVYNTCYSKSNPDGTPMDVASDKVIAKKTFNIVCDQWDVKITYTEAFGGTYQPGGNHKVTVKRNYSGTFKARVRIVKTDRRTASYESRDAEVELHDNYNHHTAQKECSWRGGFTGDKTGRAPIDVHVRFNTHNHRYSFGLGKWSGDPVTYTLGGNLFGTLEGCSGAWQQEVPEAEDLLPGGWEKGVGAPANRTWALGQESITGQASWEDYVTGVWPRMGTPPKLSVMMPPAYRLVYFPPVFDQVRFPNMKIKKTLSWEIKRPK